MSAVVRSGAGRGSGRVSVRVRVGIALLAAALLFPSGLSAQVQSGSISAGSGATSTYVADVTGWSTVGVTVGGTFTGTVAFEVITGPGAAVTVDCATFAAPGTAVNSTTAAGTWVCPVAGATGFQARFSSYTSGTAEITIARAMAPGQTVAAAGGGGGGGTTQDDDDASIATGQNVDIVGGLSMVYDGSVWRRLTIGTAGSESAQVLTVQGTASGTELPVSGTVTANAGTNLNTSALLTTAAFQTAFGTGSVVSADPCNGGTKVTVPISQTTSTELLTGTASNRTYVCGFMVTQPAASTQTFALVSGTGTTCGTSVGAMIGGTTAANGMQLPLAFGNGGATIAKSDTDADNVCLLQSSTDRISGVLIYVVAP